ncbi:MAG: recombinase family protein [Tumebacillaceae bacterium]
MTAKDYAVYVRVSTDKDEQISSIENQVDICRNWLERNGYAWDESLVHKDEGISGTLFTERPAIQEILERARQKEISMAVFKSISRLARDLKDSLEIRETLLAHGVRIVSVEEGYDSSKAGKNDLAFELWSLFAAQYSRTLSAGVSAALAAKVRRGEHIGKTPYGYQKVDGQLVIDEAEAVHIRQIFDWYNQGFGYKRITKELNALAIPSKSGGRWQMTSVQRIIKNPLYCGDFVLNQYSSVKIGGRKKQVRNPEEQWLLFRDHHPALITREVWEQANRQETARTKSTPWNVLRGLAVCADCGSNMVIIRTGKLDDDGRRIHYDYLKCSRYRRAGAAGCVNHVPIRYEDLHDFVSSELLRHGANLSLQFTDEFAAKRTEELTHLQKIIMQLEGKRKGLLDLYLEELISKAEFEAKRHELDTQLQNAGDKRRQLLEETASDHDIRTLEQAFAHLEHQQQDLYYLFHLLLKKINIHQDGTVDLHFAFQFSEQVVE